MEEHLLIETQVLSVGRVRVLEVRLKGVFSVTFCGDFRATIKRTFDEDIASVFINMTDLESIDSMGLGTLVALEWRVREKGGHVVLVSASALLMGIMKTSQLDDFFVFKETLPEAASYLQGMQAS